LKGKKRCPLLEGAHVVLRFFCWHKGATPQLLALHRLVIPLNERRRKEKSGPLLSRPHNGGPAYQGRVDGVFYTKRAERSRNRSSTRRFLPLFSSIEPYKFSGNDYRPSPEDCRRVLIGGPDSLCHPHPRHRYTDSGSSTTLEGFTRMICRSRTVHASSLFLSQYLQV
jgi:hypothetical protein